MYGKKVKLRLLFLSFIILIVILSVFLILKSLEENLVYIISPTEIKNLTKLIIPNIGIITNIGEAHIENFQNIHGIAKAKSEIIENIKNTIYNDIV